MRKHFLILMLLTLLPLAGWAADVTVKLYDFTIKYGDAQPTAATLKAEHPDAVEVTGATYDDIKGYLTFARVDDGSTNWNSNEVGVYSWTLTKAVNTGDYNIYLSSNNAKLTIEKIPTTWTTEPAVKAAAGDYNGSAKDLLQTLGVPSWGTAEYSIDGGNNWASGMPKATAVGVYTIKARVLGDAHHSGIEAANLTGTSTINGLTITEYTAPTAVASLQYTGVAQALVTSGSATGGTVKFKLDDEGDWSPTVPTATDAKDHYVVSWKIFGDATHNDLAGGNINVTIDQAPLNILLNSASKAYDGKAYSAADAKYTITGLVSRDEGKVKELNVTPNTEFVAGPSNYTVNVNTTAAKVVYSEGEGDFVLLSKNYDINAIGNTWTITTRPITITAATKSTVKNGAIPVPAATDLSVSGNIKDEGEGEDKTAILDAYKIVAGTPSTAAFATIDDVYTPTRKVAGDYAEDGDAKVAAANALLANYDITIVKGKLNVTAANLAIIPSINSSIEYNTNYSADLGYITLSGNPLAVVTDAVEPATTGGKITYEYKVAGAADDTYSTEAPTARGSYNVRVVASSVKGKGAYADLAKIDCTPAQFSIIPRVVNVVIKPVTLAKGSTVETLNAHADVVAGWDANVKESERASLKFNFMFVEAKVGADKVVKFDTNGRISAGTAYDPLDTDNNAITAELKDGAYNDNYDVHFTAGDLIFGPSALTLDTEDATLATKIAEAQATGEKYTITFDNKEMKIGEWYAMVLPFDIDPLEMVNEFDRYVIFNELNTDLTDDQNIKFTLNFEPIPAGTPFLIKFAPKAGDAANAVVDWSSVGIEFDTKAINATITDVENDYIKFTGSYTSEHLQGLKDTNGGEKVWWLGNSALGKKNAWLKPKNNSRDTEPMEAYLTAAGKDWTTYAPNFTVEDFDGSVTAIKSINADQIHGLNVKGMYNLNGMKMNNVPTQKGVYIVNGKKVVIK